MKGVYEEFIFRRGFASVDRLVDSGLSGYIFHTWHLLPLGAVYDLRLENQPYGHRRKATEVHRVCSRIIRKLDQMAAVEHRNIRDL